MNLFVQDDDLLDQKRLLFSYNKFIYLNTLSQEGGVVATPPFGFSLVPFLHFC